MRHYLKPRYIFGLIVVIWALIAGSIVLFAGNLAGPLDLLIRSSKLTAALLALFALWHLAPYIGAWSLLMPFVGVMALGNWLHRIGFRYAHLVTTRPVDLSWPVVREILQRRRLP